jgi:hypothetical protein
VACTVSPRGEWVYCLGQDCILYCFSVQSGKLEHLMQVGGCRGIGWLAGWLQCAGRADSLWRGCLQLDKVAGPKVAEQRLGTSRAAGPEQLPDAATAVALSCRLVPPPPQVHDKEPIGLAHHPHRNAVVTIAAEGVLKAWKA